MDNNINQNYQEAIKDLDKECLSLSESNSFKTIKIVNDLSKDILKKHLPRWEHVSKVKLVDGKEYLISDGKDVSEQTWDWENNSWFHEAYSDYQWVMEKPSPPILNNHKNKQNEDLNIFMGINENVFKNYVNDFNLLMDVVSKINKNGYVKISPNSCDVKYHNISSFVQNDSPIKEIIVSAICDVIRLIKHE